jgi:hypothetical protein
MLDEIGGLVVDEEPRFGRAQANPELDGRWGRLSVCGLAWRAPRQLRRQDGAAGERGRDGHEGE